MLRQDRLSSILDHGRLTVPTVPTHRPVPPSSHLDLPHPNLPDNRPASPPGTSPTFKTLLPQPGPLKVGPADLKSLVAGGRPAECGIDGSGMGGSRRAVPRTHQPRNQPAPQLQDFKEGNLQFSLVFDSLYYKPLDQDSFRPPSLQFSVYFSPLSFHSLLTDLIYHLQILSPIIASAIPSMLKFL